MTVVVRGPFALLAREGPSTTMRLEPGYENLFTRLVAAKKTVDERTRLHLTTEDDVIAQIMRRGPSLVAVDRRVGGSRDSFVKVLERARYEKLATLGAATL